MVNMGHCANVYADWSNSWPFFDVSRWRSPPLTAQCPYSSEVNVRYYAKLHAEPISQTITEMTIFQNGGHLGFVIRVWTTHETYLLLCHLFCALGLKMPNHAPESGFSVFTPSMQFSMNATPNRYFLVQTCHITYRSLKSIHGYRLSVMIMTPNINVILGGRVRTPTFLDWEDGPPL